MAADIQSFVDQIAAKTGAAKDSFTKKCVKDATGT